MLSKTEFDLLKSSQYCDKESCECYNKTGAGNIKINSRSKGQVYCNRCGNLWVLTKGTMFFDLRTPIDKVIKVLLCLSRGMGLNNTCRQEKVTADSVLDWIVKAAGHSNEFTQYMQQGMHLEQVQIDEFWSFIRKKRKTLQMKKKGYLN
jgi:transposase-like protein